MAVQNTLKHLIKIENNRNTTFVPEIYFKHCPQAIKPELPEEVKSLTGLVKCDVAEYFLYSNFQKAFKTADFKDIVMVLHSLKIQDPNGETPNNQEGEADYVIVSKTRRHIYIIESKSSPAKHEVIVQLKRTQRFLEKFFGHLIMEEENWKFFRCVHFHEMTEKVNKQICPQCQPFCITKDWKSEDFENLLKQSAIDYSESSGEVFQKLAKYLLLFQHRNKDSVTKADIAKKQHKTIQEKVGSPDNIRLWTKAQLSALRYIS